FTRGLDCVRELGNGEAAWLLGVSAIATGALLTVGFMTPIAAMATGLGAIAAAFSLVPACGATLFTANLPIVFVITRLLAILVLGPGAISVDAYLFGRREIIIVPPSAR